MTKKLTLLTFLLCIFSISSYAQTVLQGQVTDEDGGVIGASVFLFKNDVQIKAVPTDFDGNYIFTNIDPGSYDLLVKSLGVSDQRVNGVIAREDNTTKVNIELTSGSLLDEVVISDYKVPLIDFDQTSSVKTVTAEAIANSPLKSVQGLAATSAGLTSDQNGNISIRGNRSNATNFYVDGIRVSSLGLIPAAEIEQLQVITGGLAARYGDVTGGVISLTSKGPSDRFTGGLEAETSQFLDPYGFNFLNGNLSGPIIKKDNRSIVGFRLNVQYISQLDDGPSAVGVFRAPLETIQDLEGEPNFLIDGVSFPRAELLNETDIPNPLQTRPNEDRFDLDINGKIDIRFSENIDVSISGIYGTDRNRYTPSAAWGLLNWNRNPYSYGQNWRVNARWRHKIGKQGLPEEQAEGSPTLIRNASYILQFGVENIQSRTEDLNHEDRLFDYGLYGTQEVTSNPVAGFVDPESWGGVGALATPFGLVDHNSFSQQAGQFSPFIDEAGTQSPNPILSQYQEVNGQLLGTAVSVWGFFTNVGQVLNNYSKNDNTRYTVNFDSQLDILPGGNINNRHNIQFGGTYELRSNRFYGIAPRDLWSLARDAANSHFIAGVDTTIFTGNTFVGQQPFQNFEFQEYGRLIQDEEDLADRLFFRSIRENLGVGLNEFVNIDGIAAVNSGLSLDQFSASEIINWRNLGVNYAGFNYRGERSDGGSFNDFFTAQDEFGRRTFEVAPINPVYIAGYLQDKFSYEDIILRVGVRADYFDANTRVLEDPFSLYAIESAEEFSNRRDVNIPSSVDPNAKVYLTGSDKDNDGIKAFRVGDEWFSPDGTSTDPQLIFGSEPVNPSFRFTDEENNIQSRTFDPDQSFVDYVPSFRVTPRISLSFPISEDAGFFAHYDQLVQRPSSNTVFTALDYFFFEDIARLNGGGPANNPNLRPETTIDYEVGFQQRLTQSSSIKLNAYYRENRDLIQTRFLLNVPTINEYLTFDNIDFGTVKGFTATYDLRRTGNIELNASYTLQFAEGTGSSSNNGLSTRNGEVRVLIPLSFDERHRIVGNIDYRYASGDKYNGPRISGVDIFANAGANFQVSAVSGRPYTRASTINNPFSSAGFTGDINGARLPWQFNIDMRLDKNFSYKINKEGNGRGLNFNVYLRVSNLLNTQNVLGVYRVTGSPDNDGFLATQFGQDAVESVESIGKDVQSYLAAYEWASLQPGFYSLPRRIRIGGIVNF